MGWVCARKSFFQKTLEVQRGAFLAGLGRVGAGRDGSDRMGAVRPGMREEEGCELGVQGRLGWLGAAGWLDAAGSPPFGKLRAGSPRG